VQLRELVQFHQRTEVSYCRLAAVSVDPPQVQEAFKAGLGAQFPFLSDTKLILTDELGIRETTDKRHGSLPVPFTFALLPDLMIHRIFNGWYFVGRPTPDELRITIREMIGKTVEDADFGGE
jgi:peroxiredoxin